MYYGRPADLGAPHSGLTVLMFKGLTAQLAEFGNSQEFIDSLVP